MNVLLLKAWLMEAGGGLIGSRLRGVAQADARSIILELGTEAKGTLRLLVSVLEEFPALAMLDSAVADELCETSDSGIESSFTKALRFHLLGYKLIALTQEGFDRSVVITFCKTDMYGRESLKQLRVELVGRASNAYLLSTSMVSRCDGNVISIFKRVRREQNRVRQVQTGKPLPAPPPLGKYIAAESDSDGLASELAQFGRSEAVTGETSNSGELAELSSLAAAGSSDVSLEQFFTRRVAGCDVKLWPALEALLPISYDLDTLFAFILALQSGSLTPALFGLGEQGRAANTLALELWKAARNKRGVGASASLSPGTSELAQRLDQLTAQHSLAQRAAEVEELALALLAEGDEFNSRAETQAYLEHWRQSHLEWAAEIDPQRSVSENGQSLLHYSQRLRRAVDKLERMISICSAQLQQFEQARVARGSESEQSKLAPAKQQRAGSSQAPHDDLSRLQKTGVKALRYTSSDGMDILCGLNDKSNDALLRSYGSSRHLWLHVRDFPGSHVLVLSNGRDVPATTLSEAAVIAAWHSSGRKEQDVDVSYLPIKHLRRPKGAKPGQVLKTSEKVISVRPDQYEYLRHTLIDSALKP